VVIGQRFLDRVDPAAPDYLADEIAGALERKIAIVPVLVHGAEMPGPDQLPEHVRELAFRQAARLRGDPDFGADVEKLLQLLAARGAKKAAVRKGPELVLVSGPNKGSVSFSRRNAWSSVAIRAATRLSTPLSQVGSRRWSCACRRGFSAATSAPRMAPS